MTAFLVLILVAVLITSSIEAVNKFKDYIVLRDWELYKISVPASWLLSTAAVLTLNIGLTQTILEVAQVEYILTDAYHYIDLFMTICIMTGGATIVIDVLKKFQEMRDLNK